MWPTDDERLIRVCGGRHSVRRFYEPVVGSEWTGFRSSPKLDIWAHSLSSVTLASSNLVSISSSCKIDVKIMTPSIVGVRTYPPANPRWGISVEDRGYGSKEHAHFITLDGSL